MIKKTQKLENLQVLMVKLLTFNNLPNQMEKLIADVKISLFIWLRWLQHMCTFAEIYGNIFLVYLKFILQKYGKKDFLQENQN